MGGRGWVGIGGEVGFGVMGVLGEVGDYRNGTVYIWLYDIMVPCDLRGKQLPWVSRGGQLL